jgi:hypothetical protein
MWRLLAGGVLALSVIGGCSDDDSAGSEPSAQASSSERPASDSAGTDLPEAIANDAPR